MGQCCTKKEVIVKIEKERYILKEAKINRKKEKSKENILIIKNFILKNINKLIIKKNYKHRLFKLESLFCNPVTDLNPTEINNYKERFSNMLKEFIKEKKIFFDELFQEDITSKLNSFQYLKNKLGIYYNDYIYENNNNYYIEFANSLKKQKIFERNSLNSNFLNFMSKQSKNAQGTEINNTEFNDLNLGDINLIKEEKYIKKDIDILYKYCFNIEQLPSFDICQKRCNLLKLISDIEKRVKIMNMTVYFQNFIKTLYYIILLKKINCLSYTGDNIFYSINKKKLLYNLSKDSKELLSKDIKKTEEQSIKNLGFKSRNKRINPTNRAGLITINKNQENSSNITGLITNNTEYSTNNDNNDMYLLQKNGFIHQTSTKVPNSKRLRIILEKDSSSLIKNMNTLKLAKKFYKKVKRVHDLEEEYYSGQYDNTTYLYAGFGTLIEFDKNMYYIGTFKYGAKDGMGILYEDNNNKHTYFNGEFKNNKIEGYGEKIVLNDKYFCFREGLFNEQTFLHGKVKIIKDNVIKDEIEVINYEGDMADHFFNGYGILIQKVYTLNESKKYDLSYEKEYRGNFENGKENGNGIIKYNNEINNESFQYNGNFKDGLRDGFGVITYPENCFIQKYEGFFKEDKPFCTYGIVYFKSGDRYEGFFNINYQKNDIGLYSFYDPVSKIINENYFGGFKNDNKHGLGKIIIEKKDETKKMVGPFKLGEKYGQFEMYEYKKELLKIKRNSTKRRKRNNSYLGDIYENDSQKIQQKSYILFEGNDIIERSNFPIEI